MMDTNLQINEDYHITTKVSAVPEARAFFLRFGKQISRNSVFWFKRARSKAGLLDLSPSWS